MTAKHGNTENVLIHAAIYHTPMQMFRVKIFIYPMTAAERKSGKYFFCKFKEKDIIENNEIPVWVVSRPADGEKKQDVINEIDKTRLIVIARGVPSEKLTLLAEALYNGGVRLLEVTFDACGKKTDAKTAADI